MLPITTSIPTSFISAILALCLAWPAVAAQTDFLTREEPGEEFLVEQSYDTIVGFLIREYSLQGNGTVDYRTARQIIEVSYNDPAAGELGVAPYPIFYWYDVDQDGQWEMWVDRKGQGHLADIVRYDWQLGQEDLILSSRLSK
jgi:hypothetical protein